MGELPLRVLYYGIDEPLPERVPVRAGPLAAVFEAGDLRYVRFGSLEVVRRIYVAVRDRYWSTIPGQLSNVTVERSADRFRIAFDCQHRDAVGIDFAWRGTYVGSADGTIALELDGVARSTFWRNRIGFCVLHPIRECAGVPYKLTKPDGAVEQGALPRWISPHQPVREIRALACEIAPGTWSEVRFEGDVFEMEDQRNWTDASFKTYSTPLSLPRPVEVPAGTRIAQRVTVRVNGPAPSRSQAAGPTRVHVEWDQTRALPPIGLGYADWHTTLDQRERALIRALHLPHLRIDLLLSSDDWADLLRRASADASAIGARLEIALHLTDAAAVEIAALRQVLDAVRPTVARWLVFHAAEPTTTAGRVELVKPLLRDYDPRAPIGAGTDAYFTELNRDHPPVEAVEFVCYSLNPEVHATDLSSMVENLEAQAWTIESARRFSGDRPIAITPITLRPRYSPGGEKPAPPTPPGALPSSVDRRQLSLFAAGWTAGSVKYVAESGVASATYYETTGWRGVIERSTGPVAPDLFPSLAGAAFPLYHVLADVAEFRGGSVPRSRSTDQLSVECLALRAGDRRRVLVANLTSSEQTVRVAEIGGTAWLRRLDETTVERAMRDPTGFRAAADEAVSSTRGELLLSLRPFGLARIDWKDRGIG